MTRYTPLWVQQGIYPALGDRRVLGTLWPRGGSEGGDITVVSGNTVAVSAFNVAVPTLNNTGSVVCISDDWEQLLMPTAPAAGLSRYDLVLVQPHAPDIDGGTHTDFTVEHFAGQPSATPAPPATPAGTLALYLIRRQGGTAAIDPADIIDVRPRHMSTDFQGIETKEYWVPDQYFNWDVWGWELLYIGPSTVDFQPLPWTTWATLIFECTVHVQNPGPGFARTGLAHRLVRDYNQPAHSPSGWSSDWSVNYLPGELGFTSVTRSMTIPIFPNHWAQMCMVLGLQPGQPESWGNPHLRHAWGNIRGVVMRSRELPAGSL